MTNECFVGINVISAADDEGIAQAWAGVIYFHVDNIVWMSQDGDITTIFCVNGFFYHTFENVEDILKKCSQIKRRTA